MLLVLVLLLLLLLVLVVVASTTTIARARASTTTIAGADRREDILRTVRSITGQGQARSGYGVDLRVVYMYVFIKGKKLWNSKLKPILFSLPGKFLAFKK